MENKKMKTVSWMLEVRCTKEENFHFYNLTSSFYPHLSILFRLTSNLYLLTSISHRLSSNFYLFYILTPILFAITSQATAQNLQTYQQYAAENNPGLLAKYKTFEAALEKVPQAKSLQDPTLSFGFFISPIETRVGPQQARLSLTQLFPWFGTLKANSNVAALQAEAKYQIFLDQKNNLYYQVAAAYYPIYEQDKWLTLEQENIKILTSYKAIATSKFENAEGSLADVLRVDLMLKDAETSITILEKKKESLLYVFNKLLSREKTSPVEIPDSLNVLNAITILNEDSLFTENPKVATLELKIKASEMQEILIAKQGLPKLGIGLDYMIVGQRQDILNLEDNGRNALMPMLSLSLPLYRGKYKAAIKETQLTQESYALEKENVINGLSSSYESTSFELFQQEELIQLYQEQISQTQQVLNLLLSAYSNSGNEFEEVLRVQQQLLEYQKMKATALTKYQIDLAKLNYLTSRN